LGAIVPAATVTANQPNAVTENTPKLFSFGLCTKHSHTTHVLSTATIHYAHHPHYGVTVTRMRKCSSFGLHQVQVALPGGMQILIPEWMLDEDRCRGMEVVEYRIQVWVVASGSLRIPSHVADRSSNSVGIRLRSSTTDLKCRASRSMDSGKGAT